MGEQLSENIKKRTRGEWDGLRQIVQTFSYDALHELDNPAQVEGWVASFLALPVEMQVLVAGFAVVCPKPTFTKALTQNPEFLNWAARHQYVYTRDSEIVWDRMASRGQVEECK